MTRPPELGDQPIQDQYLQKMNDLARDLDQIFNDGLRGPDRRTGFVLMVFPFGNLAKGDARCNYISNGADRKDVVALMKEMIGRFERADSTKKEGIAE